MVWRTKRGGGSEEGDAVMGKEDKGGVFQKEAQKTERSGITV